MGDVNDNSPQNKDPAVLTSTFSSVVELVQTYGWFIVAAVVLALYLWNKFGSTFNKWQQSREQQAHKKFDVDPDVARRRLEAMEKARQKMQEQLNLQAETYLEKQKRKEEEKRKEKIEDWDRHLEGKGYRSKYRPKEDSNETPPLKPKPKPKTALKETDYNPLMGDSSRYRPPRRSGLGGG